MKSPDRFGQLQGEIVPMERYENPLLKPIALSGTPEDLDTVQAEVLLLIQQNHHSPQEQNALEILSLNIFEQTELQIPEVRTETKQTEYPTHYHTPYPDSTADLGDFDDIHSYIDDLGSEISYYSTTSVLNTSP